MNPIVNVVVPIYLPDQRLITALDSLSHQSVAVQNIYLMCTGEESYARLLQLAGMDDSTFRSCYPSVVCSIIDKSDFDHGGTRNQAFNMAVKQQASYVIAMTQDAVPESARLVENLLSSFEKDDAIAVAFARQLPNDNANEEERCTRIFNYPETSKIKSEDDLKQLGIKTYFCSNVCAMYRTDVWSQLGGFVSPALFNEDMIYAATTLKNGYKIYYAAEARVIHSHNYNITQYFRRNFDLGVSQLQYAAIFNNISSENEGVNYVKFVVKHLWKNSFITIPLFLTHCLAKWFGYRMGKLYTKLPPCVILRCTSNPTFWKSYWGKSRI